MGHTEPPPTGPQGHTPWYSAQPARVHTAALDTVRGATGVPILQGRKLRSKGTRILARGHTGMTNRRCPDPHSWLRGAPTEGGVALCGSLHEPQQTMLSPRQVTVLAQSTGSLTQLRSSYLESLPKPPTKQTLTGLISAGSLGGGGGNRGEEGMDSFLLTQQIM